MSDPKRILVIDDDKSICDVLRISLRREGYDVTTIMDPRTGLDAFQRNAYDLVIQDIKMPQMDGIELLQKLRALEPEVPVVIITAFSTWDRAVQAMRLGAYDYIRKPFDMSLDLKATVRRALAARGQRARTAQSESLIQEKLGFVLGYSRHMREVWDLIRKAAGADSTCLIVGESGTGKELVARSLHLLSPRNSRPFVAINCGAIPEPLLESELFGHIRGSFTDAHQDRPGLIEMANGGTVFLDEISEMNPKLQVKLLRVLEEREYRPVGATTAKRADVRFVTATNKDLEAEVKAGNFRQDLFYRLNVIPIHLPPLRDRPEDVPILSEYFMRKCARDMDRRIRGFTEEAKKALQEYSWPGNVRELENLIQRAVTLCEHDRLDVDDLFGERSKARSAGRISNGSTDLPPEGISLDEKVRDLEMEYVKRAMEMTGGNMTKAARLLGMSLSSFRHKLNKYGLARPGHRPTKEA